MLEGAKMTRGSTGLFRFIAHATARTSHESWAMDIRTDRRNVLRYNAHLHRTNVCTTVSL